MGYWSSQSGREWNRWYERTDGDELDIDIKAGTVLINGQRFRLQDGNVFIKSAKGACGPRAAQVGTVSSSANLGEVLGGLQSALESQCGVLSLKVK